MLYSSKYNFVFIKTRKTASSSAELVLQQLCLPPTVVIDNSAGFGGAMHNSDFGIVGARWHLSQRRKPNESMYWSHMPAREIYKKMPEAFVNSMKISCSRHPVTKYISAFHHFGGYSRSDASRLKQENRLDRLQEDFSDYVKNVNLSERAILSVRGKCCVDDFIRQESFGLCMERVLTRIGIEDPERSDLIKSTPSAKTNVNTSRHNRSAQLTLATRDYLNNDTIKLISAFTEWDCEVMGYDINVF